MPHALMQTDTDSALTERIYAILPVQLPAYSRLLSLLEISASREVATAAVTCGTRSRLLINPDFVARNCEGDEDLITLVLHELMHVTFGHTRLFKRPTALHNLAFDAVINAHLCHLRPRPAQTALFRRLYAADELPWALLRPPEGWDDKPVWRLRRRAGQLHRALYEQSSLPYAEIFDLLARQDMDLPGDEALQAALLGNHAHSEDRENPGNACEAPFAGAPEFNRAVRELLAEWPMLTERGGRDQGDALRTDHIDRQPPAASTRAILRRAVLSLAVAGESTALRRLAPDQPVAGVQAFPSRHDRRAGPAALLGSPPLLYATRQRGIAPGPFQQVHVYLDVSGSMVGLLPVLYTALERVTPWLHPYLHLFSTEICDVPLQTLRDGKRLSTGGTEIGPVSGHILEHRITEALIITDGQVGEVPEDHVRRLARRNIRIGVCLSAGGEVDFAQALGARVHWLPE